MRILGRGTGHRRRRYAGGVAIDGDRVTLVVCATGDGADARTVRFDRETVVGDLAAAMAEAEALVAFDDRGAGIDWIVALGGGEVLHEVILIPPQVRAFHDVRLEACLAGTSWGNVDAVEAAGYRLGHTFERDRCVVGVAPLAALAALSTGVDRPACVTSSAVALLELLRAIEPGLFSPGSAAVLALDCGATSVAACIVESGEVRVLHQTGLLPYLRELVATSVKAPSAPAEAPVEFEFGGYSAPVDADARRVVREEDPGAEVESGAYQAALMRVVQELLTLYREQYGTGAPFPQTIYLTGDSATRHAVRAFMVRYLGGQFAVEELDAALVVRIDDPDVARRFAALQNLYGGALGALATGLRAERLEFDLGDIRREAASASLSQGSGRRAGPSAVSREFVVALLVALVVAGGASGLRGWLLARDRSTIEAQTETETNRQAQLRALTEERKQAEARIAHTRELLAVLDGLRARQAVPPSLLATIAASVPSEAELDEVSLVGDTVKIAGFAKDKEQGALLALALERLHDTFADVTPQTDTKLVKVYDEAAEAEVDQTSYTFTITARYLKER